MMRPAIARERETELAPAKFSSGKSQTRWGLASLSLAMLLSSLGTSIANIALPALTEAFAASFQAVQWVVLAYLLAITCLIVSAGRLGDLIGRKRLLMMGLFLFTAGSALAGIAPALWLLIAARALQGAGAAIMMALTIACVGEIVPKARTGSAMGLLGTMSAVGTALGPSMGGVLIAAFGWRAIFLVIIPLGLLALLLAHRHLPAESQAGQAGRPGFDRLGTLLLTLALAAYALAMTMGQGHFGPLNAALLSAAIVGAGLFILAEARVASPLIRPALLRDPALTVSLAVNVLVSTVMMATLVVGPFYLSRGLGLDAAAVGIVLALGPVISALSGVVAGRIVDRFGAARIVILGLIEMAAGALALSLCPPVFGLAGYIAAIAILTPGYQLFQAANNTAVMTDAGAERRGLVSGLLNLSRNLGLITGASVMGAIFAHGAAMQKASSAADIAAAAPGSVASGLQLTFAVSAVLVLVTLGLVVLVRTIATARQPLMKARRSSFKRS